MTMEAYAFSNGVDPLDLSPRTASGTDDDCGGPAPETESGSGEDRGGPALEMESGNGEDLVDLFPNMARDSESDLSLWRFQTSDAVPEMLVAALQSVVYHTAGFQ
jgi:hypothetical protein